MSDRKRLTVDELRLTPEFQKLTQKQQLFVATYCGGGLVDGHYDAVVATNAAYQCKSIANARVMSYSMLTNIRIVEVLNRHFNKEPIEEFLVSLDRAINNKNLTMAQLQALRLKCDILGFANKLPTEAAASGVIPVAVLKAERAARKPRTKASKPAPQPVTKAQYTPDSI